MVRLLLLALAFYSAIAEEEKDCKPGYRDNMVCPRYKQLCSLDLYKDFMTKYCSIICNFCKEVPLPPPRIVDVDISACIAAHNEKRRLHGAPDLVWDASLATGAANWALQQARKKSFKHGSTGENLFSAGTTGSKVYTCVDAVKNWYSEEKYYNYDKPAESTGIVGHFTQVVWKSSAKLGVGKATYYDGRYFKTIIVARYTPAGNNGQNSVNVLRIH